jgi:hypothetical protein
MYFETFLKQYCTVGKSDQFCFKNQLFLEEMFAEEPGSE